MVKVKCGKENIVLVKKKEKKPDIEPWTVILIFYCFVWQDRVGGVCCGKASNGSGQEMPSNRTVHSTFISDNETTGASSAVGREPRHKGIIKRSVETVSRCTSGRYSLKFLCVCVCVCVS